MPTRRFEFIKGKPAKFWQINQRGRRTTVRFGRIGANGQTISRDYASSDAAKKAAETLIVAKTKKGYREVANPPKTKPPNRTVSKSSRPKDSSAAQNITSVASIPKNETLTFLALVAPSGSGGGAKSGREKLWTFTASLVAWKVDGGPLIRENLLVAVPEVDDRKLSRLGRQFRGWMVVRFKAQLVERRRGGRGGPGGWGGWKVIRLELTRFLGESRDSDLLAVKAELSQPVEFHDRVFGRVRYNHEVCYFDGIVLHRGKEIGLWFDTESMEEAKTMVTLAKPLWRARVKWFKEFRSLVLEKMYDQCQEWWYSEDDEPLTTKKFLQLLGDPCLLTFHLDDGELVYTMGGWSERLFGDHGIDVRGTLKDGLIDVD